MNKYQRVQQEFQKTYLSKHPAVTLDKLHSSSHKVSPLVDQSLISIDGAGCRFYTQNLNLKALRHEFILKDKQNEQTRISKHYRANRLKTQVNVESVPEIIEARSTQLPGQKIMRKHRHSLIQMMDKHLQSQPSRSLYRNSKKYTPNELTDSTNTLLKFRSHLISNEKQSQYCCALKASVDSIDVPSCSFQHHQRTASQPTVEGGMARSDYFLDALRAKRKALNFRLKLKKTHPTFQKNHPQTKTMMIETLLGTKIGSSQSDKKVETGYYATQKQIFYRSPSSDQEYSHTECQWRERKALKIQHISILETVLDRQTKRKMRESHYRIQPWGQNK